MGMSFQILIMWIITIITSKGLDLMLSFRMLKDVADAGYKFEPKKVDEANRQLNPRAKEATKLERMIPFYNIMKACDRINLYIKHRNIVLNQFDVMDVLEEMSKLEKEEYDKKATGMNALLAPLKVKMRLEKATSITIKNEEGESKLYFEIVKEPFDLKIIEVTGPLSRVSEEEQKRAIFESYKKLVDSIEDQYGNFENFKKACINNDEVIINSKEELFDEYKSNEDQSVQTSKGISEQKKELQELKEELLGNESSEKDVDKKIL